MALLEVTVRRGVSHTPWKWLTALSLAGWVLLTGTVDRETLDVDKATALKVAYLRYIAEYTTWPEPKQAKGGPLNFCVLGHDVQGMTARIEELIIEPGIHIQGRPVHLKVLRKGILPFIPSDAELTESIRQCHLLYVFPSEKERWVDLSQHLQNVGVVTVSEMDGFSQTGGMIQFVLTHEPGRSGLRYNLHINLKNCLQAGLRLSAKLLNLKQAVKIVESP